jgi:hypothetical protein
MNMGKVMVISAILTLPCYLALHQLGQNLPVWTYYITGAGFVLGVPLIFIENWLSKGVKPK